MTDATTWIKLYRRLLDHWLFSSKPEYLKLWLFVILSANWKQSRAVVGGEVVTIERGEVLTSYRALAEKTGATVQQVKTFLKLCESDGMIAVKSNTAATRITVLNYKDLQGVDISEQHSNNTAATHDQHTTNTIIRSIELKKERKKIEDSIARSANASAPAVIGLQQNDGDDYAVTADQVAEWQALYPAVDVMQALRSIRGWLAANPTRRKTPRGMCRFVNAWLAREQNRGNGGATQATKRTTGDRALGDGYGEYFAAIASQFTNSERLPPDMVSGVIHPVEIGAENRDRRLP
jgi:DNA-binding transcriptional regulator YhcF (GntR family)